MAVRSVVVASADAGLRHRLNDCLTGLRWTVREASGGAEAMALVELERPEALLVDSWLPDLEAGELTGQLGQMYPGMDLLRMDGGMGRSGIGTRSPRRHELLHAMREAQEPGVASSLGPAKEAAPGAGSASAAAPAEAAALAEAAVLARAIAQVEASEAEAREAKAVAKEAAKRALAEAAQLAELPAAVIPEEPVAAAAKVGVKKALSGSLPEMVGESAVMRELARMIRLVAPRSATVLLEGETGTGKEVAAKAVHRLSARAGKPFVVLNCAAIPESLLEAELFGHTRGAFTGAVQSRTGRIEAAHGGTLFLDEIGEMPMALQAKMLRFLENGELQRVGDNETMRVDVRVIAATHQPLELRAEERRFRLDLYHRLAVFPLEIPPLRERMEDLPLLVECFLEQMGRELPRKSISKAAMEKLRGYAWPGNVRELMHVLERGSILAEDQPEIGVEHVRVRKPRRS
jgi:transcriptional regulator with GAF, ATPase, and Fis domain